jgi:ATP-dependent DNA helicase RecQ
LSKIYQSLANFYQLAMGSGAGESFDFEVYAFSDRFQYHAVEVYNALKKLEEEGLIQFNESYYNPSTLHVQVDHGKLYEFQVANAKFDDILKMLLRLYGGELFSGFMKISESYLAKALKVSVEDVTALLQHLHKLGIVLYSPVKDKPQITFILPRQDAEKLPINKKRLEARKKLILAKAKAVADFAEKKVQCRMQVIQDYFNETSHQPCGICDICIERRKKANAKAYDELKTEIMTIIRSKPITIEALEQQIAPKDRELFVDVVRELVDESRLAYDKVWKLKINSSK